MRKENLVNVGARRQKAAERVNGNGNRLHESLHAELESDTPFPQLEAVLVAAKKNPYAAIGAMIAIAGIVMTALGSIAVAMFTAILMLYGQVRENNALMGTVVLKVNQIEASRIDDGKVMRSYEAARDKQIGFIVGVMSSQQRQAFLDFQKQNPVPPATTQRDDRSQ